MRQPRLCLSLLVAILPAALAQAPTPAPATVPVLMLSDLHFDPYRNITEARLKQLTVDPPEKWDDILSRPLSAAEQKDAAAVALKRTGCDSTKLDTDYNLLTSSLIAEQAAMPDPLFITVSGDLITHNFDCKYNSLVKNHTAAGLSDFAAKTGTFMAIKLHAAYPKAPIYLTLGNNDSGCTDYFETEATPKQKNPYLDQLAQAFAAVALDAGNAKRILATVPTRGDYSVMLPQPFADTKLIVLQDMFESASYHGSCPGGSSAGAAANQIAWLKAQLADTSVKHFWIMAHIAPGVDPYGTIVSNRSKQSPGCPGSATLKGNDLAGTLRDSTSDIELALYGHTHMDEMRLITDNAGQGKVAGRLNPSISTWNGNYPAFTVASVDPAKALLVDFTVYHSVDKTGAAGDWSSNKYTYSDAYGQPDYSAASLTALTGIFKTDPTGTAAGNYKQYYESGATSNWSAYVCAIVSDTPDQYNTCNVCGTGTTR
ncbi:MAG TPA: hypothetical protein VGN16_10760 [Acidobacteriaceae bacterium]|jgi:sphingomyelin phosphodiesterase acid-like 3